MTARNPPKPNPLERERVLAILQYLQAAHPKFIWIRVEPPGAARARAYRGKGYAKKMPEDTWGDGVADILGIGHVPFKFSKTHVFMMLRAVAFEVKRPGENQRPSQIEFQRRWEAAGGLYRIVHGPDEVMVALKGWGI